MRKLLLSALTLGLAITGFAQEKAKFAPVSKAELAKVKKSVMTSNTNKGAAIFADDFANGLDGNNGIGAWTAEDSEAGDIWHLANPAGPEGEFSTNIGPLASTTASNGWMIFDCDGYNTEVNQTGTTGIASDVQGFLTSPTIDLTDEPSVIIEFQQYFRYCCFGTFPMAVEVSSDGGTTWTSFPSNDYFIPSANAASDDMTTTIDISCAAGGQADVQVRFSYNPTFESGYSHYFWGVDDVVIYGNPNANDLAIDQVTNGDIYNFYEFRVTAMEQVIPAADGGVTVGTYFQNYGINDQTNVSLTVDILDEIGSVLNTNVIDAGDIPSFANSAVCPSSVDSIYVQTGWAPDAPGTYIVRSTLDSDATDDTPGDNVVEKSIEFTDATMGHDDATAFDLELLQSTDTDGEFEQEGFANVIQMNNGNSEAYGVVAYFGPTTTPGLTIQARLYTAPGFASVDDPFEFVEYTIEEADIPADLENPIATFIEFENVYSLDALDVTNYVVSVEVPEAGVGELTILANANQDSDFSTAVIDQSGAGDFVFFNRPDVPGVRLALDEIVGIEEISLIDGVSAVQNVPNPVVNSTIISYTLVNALDVNIEIVDITGKVVYSENQGTRAAGQHQVTIDASEMADGVYFYSLISGDQRMTRKMVVNK